MEAGCDILPCRDADIVARGPSLYAQHCAACRGDNLERGGNWRQTDVDRYLPTPPHDPSECNWHRTDELLIRITTLGAKAIVGGGYHSPMMGFEDQLDRAEIIAVLASIKSTWPAAIIAQHNQINKVQGH